MKTQRIPFDKDSLRAARLLKSGINPDAIATTCGISAERIGRIADAYSSVPHDLLVRIERLMHEKDRLRCMVSSLI